MYPCSREYHEEESPVFAEVAGHALLRLDGRGGGEGTATGTAEAQNPGFPSGQTLRNSRTLSVPAVLVERSPCAFALCTKPRRRWQNRLQRQFLTCSIDEFRRVHPWTHSIALLGPVVG